MAQQMIVTVEGNRARIPAPLPQSFLSVAVKLEGHKAWLKAGGGFSFEPTIYNMRLITTNYPDAKVDDRREVTRLFETTTDSTGLVGAPREGVARYDPTGGKPYASRTMPLGKFQVTATEHCLVEKYAGLLMEQGTGKSKVSIDVAGIRYSRGEITGVVVVAFNGVHQQWVDEAIPDHLGEMVPRRTWAWNGKKPPEWLHKTDKLAIFTINFEAALKGEGEKAVREFIKAHRGKVIFVVDESQRIKNPDAKATIAIVNMGKYAEYRIILTGTPYAKDLTDMWSQFKFLDETAFGHKYKSTFRAQFCQMHPKIQGVVVGSKNEEKFYSICAPYTFRATKEEELDLPPKVYDKVQFELQPEQRKLYDKLRTEFIADLEDGTTVTIKHALTLVTRLQQVTNGFISLDKENPEDPTTWQDLPWNPRLDALKRLRKARLGKMVIWCRFRKDVEKVMELFGDSAVSYFGGTGKDERIENKRAFIDDPSITELVSNPAVGGTGVDGLQKVAHTAIYYSNSHNSIHRWQSEDRTHRIGMTGTCTYFDLVARNTMDAPILSNLRRKKQLSDLMLDNIRLMLRGDAGVGGVWDLTNENDNQRASDR